MIPGVSIAAEDHLLNSQCVATVDIEQIMFVDHVSYRIVNKYHFGKCFVLHVYTFANVK